MDIRKISVGPDYKSGAMHYLVGQDILNGNFHIHLIRKERDSVCIYIQQKDEILLWKEFNSTMPISIDVLKIKKSKTNDFIEQMTIADEIHNIEMKLNGVKPTDSSIDCIGCGS